MNSLNHAYITQSISLLENHISTADTVTDFLDSNFPLHKASHQDVVQYRVYFEALVAHLKSGICVGLLKPSQFNDYGGDKESPTSILLGNSHQQIELKF